MNSLLQTLFHVLSLRRAVYDMPTDEENRCIRILTKVIFGSQNKKKNQVFTICHPCF